MAYIDKIYGTCYEWDSLFLFLTYKKPNYLNSMRPRPGNRIPLHEEPLASFSQKEDEWLFKNCHFGFVQDKLREQYPNWYDDEMD